MKITVLMENSAREGCGLTPEFEEQLRKLRARG